MYIILIPTVVVFCNVGFLVIRACDLLVFAKQYFEFSETQFLEVRGPRTPVIFDATATSDVRDVILDGSLCRYQFHSNNTVHLPLLNCEHFVVSLSSEKRHIDKKTIVVLFSSYSRSSVKINIGSKQLQIKNCVDRDMRPNS